MVGGKWTKNGKTISFSISDPIPYSDYYLDAQAIAKQLNALGFNVTVDGIGNPTVWQADITNGTFDTAIHWSNQGPTPYQIYEGNLNATLTAPVGKPAATNIGRWDNTATQAALAEFAGSNSPSAQKAAVTSLENIMTTQVPVAPLLYGAAWCGILHARLHRLAVGEQPLHEPFDELAVPRGDRPAPQAGLLNSRDDN